MGSQATREVHKSTVSPSILEADQRRTSDTNRVPTRDTPSSHPPTSLLERAQTTPKEDRPRSSRRRTGAALGEPRSLPQNETPQQMTCPSELDRKETQSINAANAATPTTTVVAKRKHRQIIAPSSCDLKTSLSSVSDAQPLDRPEKHMTDEELADAYGDILGFDAPPNHERVDVRPNETTPSALEDAHAPEKSLLYHLRKKRGSAPTAGELSKPSGCVPTRPPSKPQAAGRASSTSPAVSAGDGAQSPDAELSSRQATTVVMSNHTRDDEAPPADNGVSTGHRASSYDVAVHEHGFTSRYAFGWPCAPPHEQMPPGATNTSYQASTCGYCASIHSAGHEVYERTASIESLDPRSVDDRARAYAGSEYYSGGRHTSHVANVGDAQTADWHVPTPPHRLYAAPRLSDPQPLRVPDACRMQDAAASWLPPPHRQVNTPLLRPPHLCGNASAAYPSLAPVQGADYGCAPWSSVPPAASVGGPLKPNGAVHPSVPVRRATVPATSDMYPSFGIDALAGEHRLSVACLPMDNAAGGSHTAPPRRRIMGPCHTIVSSAPPTSPLRPSRTNRGPQPDIERPERNAAYVGDTPTTAELELAFGFSLQMARWVDSPELED